MSDELFSAYSDESGIYDERYQAIGVVSGPDTELAQLRTRLKDILGEEGVNELKFLNITRSQSKRTKAARRFLTYTVKEFASQVKLRIDVIIWDDQNFPKAQTEERASRLEDMYHRVLTYIGRQWNQISWNFYPDENSQIQWEQIVSFLNRTRLNRPKPRLLRLFENQEADQIFKFSKVKQLSSFGEPLIQLADLFAGMGRFSRGEGEQCVQWLDSWGNKAQLRLPEFFNSRDRESETSRTKRARFELVGKFDNICKRYKMGVSLRTNKCLWTYNPSHPINFWNC